MKIHGLERDESDGWTRLFATVDYEDMDRPPVQLRFEVEARHGSLIREGYEPFLLSCFPAALFHGEARLRVEGAVCPELLDNVRAAIRLQAAWRPAGRLPQVEAETLQALPPPEPGTASLVSGGVDSLSTVCRNHGLYERGDPRRITRGIFVYGLDVGNPELRARPDVFERGKALLSEFLEGGGCELVPVRTNARDVEPHGSFYATRQFAAILSGVGHALRGGFGTCISALDLRSDAYAGQREGWGSHPWLNGYFSSSGLRFVSQMDSFTRLEKYRFLAQRPESLDALRVCYTTDDIPEGHVNCGRCGKCLRTRIELLASGLEDRAATFPAVEMDLNRIAALTPFFGHELEFFEAPIPRLREIGRDDIADRLEAGVARYRRKARVQAVKDGVRAFDRDHLDERIGNAVRAVKRLGGRTG